MARAKRVEVRGGPHDGATVAVAGPLRWLDGLRGHRGPGPGRTLYQLRGGGREPPHYAFVGANARFCKPCGAVVGRRKDDPLMACPMCGSPTSPTSQPPKEE